MSDLGCPIQTAECIESTPQGSTGIVPYQVGQGGIPFVVMLLYYTVLVPRKLTIEFTHMLY